MKISSGQNIFDVTLQAYGGLDFLVMLANDNGFNLDEIPVSKSDLIIDETQGEKRVKIFVTENNFVFVNEAIEKTAALLAADDTALSPETDVIFIYK